MSLDLRPLLTAGHRDGEENESSNSSEADACRGQGALQDKYAAAHRQLPVSDMRSKMMLSSESRGFVCGGQLNLKVGGDKEIWYSIVWYDMI